jgi:glycosyltransferase
VRLDDRRTSNQYSLVPFAMTRLGTEMKISVIVVSYNSAATVRDTVQSFFDQDHPEKELLLIDGGSTDNTLDIVRSFPQDHIRILSEPDKGPFDAMNKGLRRYSGDAVGVLNSDDTFHDSHVLARIAEGLGDADIVYGDLDMVSDHETKTLVRAWRAGPYHRWAFQCGWMAPHPTFYCRRQVIDRAGEFDLSYPTTADYDLIVRAIALHDFRVHYIRAVLADFRMGGISTKSWKTTLRASLDLLRSRRAHLNAPVIDPAFFLWPLRRLLQVRRPGAYIFRQKGADSTTPVASGL